MSYEILFWIPWVIESCIQTETIVDRPGPDGQAVCVATCKSRGWTLECAGDISAC